MTKSLSLCEVHPTLINACVVLAAVDHAVGQAPQPRHFGSLAGSALPRRLDCKRAGMLPATLLRTSTYARSNIFTR